MSYDPVTETTRQDVVDMIAHALARVAWSPRDFSVEADDILDRIERQAILDARQNENDIVTALVESRTEG